MSVKRENYTDLINYVANKSSVSYYRAGKILSTLCKKVQEACFQGKDIDIEGLIFIEYTTSKYHIYENIIYGIEQQIEDVTKELNLPENEVMSVIYNYFKRIKELVETGYQVNIKGIGYIIPKEDSKGVYCDTRVSPVMKKPESAEFIVLNKDGIIETININGADLRFRVYLSDKIKIPYKLVPKTNKFKLEIIEDI